MIMIDSKKKTGELEGTIAELTIELQMAVSQIIKYSELEGEELDDLKTFMLESVAFALCTHEERNEILESKVNELLKRKGDK